MAKRSSKLLKEIMALPRRTIAGVALSHLVLLVIALFGGLSYLIMQAVLAVELVLLSLATIPLYPERGIARHAFDMLKLTCAASFIYFFVFVTYGAASDGGHGNAMVIAWQSLDDADLHDLFLSLLYVAVSLGISLAQILRLPDPRKAWAKSRLIDGTVTMLAMFLMSIVAISLGSAIISVLKNFGFPVDADSVLIILMVITRFVFALIAATIPEGETDAIAANPYVD